MNKKPLQEFLSFLKTSKQRQFNFFLTFLLFCLIPVRNSYTDLVIAAQAPLVRSLEIDLPEISAYPVNITGQTAPGLTAFSALVIDVPSKAVIMAKNPDQELFPASVTKIMTALVSLDYYQLDDVLEIKQVKNIGRVMKLEKGEKITVENLLYGLLVQSGNDVAYVLADNYPGGLEAFIAAMNQKAREFHLEKTHFINPAGLDAYGHLSTSHDLAILAAEAMKNEVFKKIVNTRAITVTDVSGEIKHELTNVNQLLGKVPGLKGIKTGWTGYAGECLIADTERGEREIITVVLSSEDRFGETKKLIEWVFTNFQWEELEIRY